MYLLTGASALFGEAYVRGSLLVGESAAKTASNLIESNLLYRIGLATDLLTFTGVVVLVWALYQLLSEVDRRLATLALMFRLVELGVHFSAIGLGMVALSLLAGGEYTQGFAAPELHGLVGVALRAQMAGLGIGFIPLGLGSASFALLLLRSGYVPKFLAGWGVFASLLLAAYSFGVVLSPNTSDYFYVGMLPMFIYEVSLGVWLLSKGVPASARSEPFPSLKQAPTSERSR
ncbi:MAG: DUF4386 domain-containing protein [Rubrivivax sp.]|nr:DUF4386 domain-containing protein [Rubrivivax sp.]